MQIKGESPRMGKIIAFVGLPASGKSSIVKEMSQILTIRTFLEPEESLWPDAVLKRDLSGYFTAISWFRSIRVPQLYLADKLRQAGETIVLDSYYDKLISQYLGKPGMEWLINPEDNYYKVVKSISELDFDLLPNVDCIVFLQIDFDVWMHLVNKRNRVLDNDILFRKSFNTQAYFLDAVYHYARLSGAKVVIHQQANTSPKIEALKVCEILRREKIIA